MAHHLYTLLCLLIESLAARRGARVRFLKEEDPPLPDPRLAPGERGRELGHPVKGLISVVQHRTYRR